LEHNGVANETDIQVNGSNRRYQMLSFDIPPGRGNQTLHGFAGTFESELFAGVTLSIKPDTHTPAMFSWFPLYLPLATPLLVRTGDVVSVHLWRCLDEHRVWYEWCLSSPVQSPVQNSNGKSYAIRLR
jgi:type II protein arginine methyltransferase